MKTKRFRLLVMAFALTAVVFLIIYIILPARTADGLAMTYPYEKTVFPADIASQTFVWNDADPEAAEWQVKAATGGRIIAGPLNVRERYWQPTPEEWATLRAAGPGEEISLTVNRFSGKRKGRGAVVNFSFSADPVEAPIFVRSVPLPFKFARENMKKIRWVWGSVSSQDKPSILLDNLPTCGNCHSFTPDGRKLAMDVDANNDKGSYVITSFGPTTDIAGDSIISWSTFQEGKFTYGLLSQISPDGRYVVSTLRDCEIFTDRPEIEYSQLFFPFKGILVIYDRLEKRFFELEGANDTLFVQSNPTWTPDGKYILFCKSRARHYPESGIHNGSVARPADMKTYLGFEKRFLDRDSLMKFDIYMIPFNDGKGGKALPVEGASQNGMSNYFPRVSPDGKWLVFCQAESFMLLQRDSRLVIRPMEGGETRVLEHNTANMNSWHSWSPNSKWLVFSSKAFGPYTQLFLTHINDDGTNTPPVYLDRFTFTGYANNIPEFVNTPYSPHFKIAPSFLTEDEFMIRNGEILQKSGDEQGALLAFTRAVEKFPQKPEGYYRRGRIHFNRKKVHEALRDLDRAVTLEGHNDYFVTRGTIHLEMGNREKALDDFTRALRRDSTDHRAWSYLGILRAREGDPDGAEEYFAKAIDIYPFDYYSFYQMGKLQFEQHQYPQAQNALTSALQYCDNPGMLPLILELRGTCRRELNDLKGALADFTQALEHHPEDPQLYLAKAETEKTLGLTRQAEKSYQKAKELSRNPHP